MTELNSWQRDFISLAIEVGALSFGEFTLKSGRVSPYFFNAGQFHSGASLAGLASCYAAAIVERDIQADFLFGPAYKGIPLAAAIAVQLYNQHGLDMPYAFNRKEFKDHGEGGHFVGAALQGRALIVDDVITAGTAIREAVDLLEEAGVSEASVLIGLDRQECGQTSERSAVQELRADPGIAVHSIVSLTDIRHYIAEEIADTELLSRVDSYRQRYGAES